MKMKKNFISSLKAYALENKVPIINDSGLDFLLNLIQTTNAKDVLEIGTAIGYSAINIANLDCKVITVERDYFMYKKALESVKEAELEDMITVINADALEVEIHGLFDLIFIDAAKAQYLKFFEKFKHNLRPTGIIVCDNLDFHNLNPEEVSRGTRQLLKKLNNFKTFLNENNEFETQIYHIGDGISVSKRRNT